MLVSCGRSTAPPPPRPAALPPVSGTLTVTGISQPVRIVRDRWGVPHIAAQNEHDLFFAQGFVQAQDRLFQMDLWRRSAQGRLAQVMGPNFIDRDAMTRRMQYHGNPGEEWASYGPDTRDIAQAFVTGINAWVTRARADLPQEFSLAGWRPELWTPEDLLNRTDAFLSSGDAPLETFRARLAGAMGDAKAAALLPGDLPRGLPRDLDRDRVGDILFNALRRVGTTPFFSGFAGRFSGSNAWALAGSRTATGAPIVASDPHRPLVNPSLRYLVHLRAPGWNVMGATSPWLPGVTIGHNDRVAWGMAAYPADTQDLHAESANAVVERAKDPIVVKGEAKPVVFEREYTRNGVVIASDREHRLVFTLTWSGFEPGGAAELGALALDRARSTTEFREGLSRWKMPAVDVVFADAAGIGSQIAGRVARAAAGPFVVAANEDAARASRLRAMLTGAARFTIDDVRRQQQDVVASNAERLVTRLAGAHATDPDVEQARQILLEWDRRVTADSAAARLYVVFERLLWRKISAARVPAPILDDYLFRAGFNLDDAMSAPQRTLLEALADAARAVKAEPQVTFRHPLGITQASRGLFDVGPFRADGYEGTVNAFFTRSNVDYGASFRMIADVGDWDRSIATSAPGQSEWPRSPHFSDLAALWAKGAYFPLVFSEDAIQKNAESTLTLRPR